MVQYGLIWAVWILQISSSTTVCHMVKTPKNVKSSKETAKQFNYKIFINSHQHLLSMSSPKSPAKLRTMLSRCFYQLNWPFYPIWLVVGGWATPLKNMTSSIKGWLDIPNMNGKIMENFKNGNQTTNQLWFSMISPPRIPFFSWKLRPRRMLWPHGVGTTSQDPAAAEGQSMAVKKVVVLTHPRLMLIMIDG